MSSQDVIPCSVCVTAYNEEENIGSLLAALLDQHVHEVDICEIVVVASACTDNTVPIVKEFMAKDPRIVLIEQERREGKTAAINEFLAVAKCEVCVIESGDTIPHEYAVEHLVRMFKDPGIGMVGAQKVAVNTPDHIAGLLSHLRLRMEHELCLEIPRLGEMIAFRKVFEYIPPDIAMDEDVYVRFVHASETMRIGDTFSLDLVRVSHRDFFPPNIIDQSPLPAASRASMESTAPVAVSR